METVQVNDTQPLHTPPDFHLLIPSQFKDEHTQEMMHSPVWVRGTVCDRDAITKRMEATERDYEGNILQPDDIQPDMQLKNMVNTYKQMVQD